MKYFPTVKETPSKDSQQDRNESIDAKEIYKERQDDLQDLESDKDYDQEQLLAQYDQIDGATHKKTSNLVKNLQY